MKRISDIQRMRVVEVEDRSGPDEDVSAEILVVGGGLGGVAAALAACEAGRTVCLTEETDWLGGQATSQAVTALDENRWIETTGASRTYQAWRHGIRDWYRRNRNIKPGLANNPRFSPGNRWGGRLGFEPMVAVEVIEARLAPFVATGQLHLLKRCKAFAVGRVGDRVTHIDLVHLDSGRRYRARSPYVIDASELGDLLALGAADWVTGAEARSQTGEPHAWTGADAEDVQSFTYCFAIEHRPGQRHLIDRPADYARNRSDQPYTLTLHYSSGKVLTYGIFERRPGTAGSFWTYRRMIEADRFDDPHYPHDIAMINWPGNDYRGGTILVDDPVAQLAQLRAARDLSLGLLYWLQTEVARDDGGTGYPEFRLDREIMGTADGLCKFPYIRECRRIRALHTIVEQEVSSAFQKGPRAAHFDDSVGIGFYGIDLHESKRGRKQVIEGTRPFQVPFGALISASTVNLLAGCKNIGTTHITNGCYRLHPIEWAIGEAAGAAAALCIERGTTPADLRRHKPSLRELQRRLVDRGAPIMWYDNVPANDPRFARVQMLPFESPDRLSELADNLHAPDR